MSGVVLLSEAETGQLQAILDAGAVTAVAYGRRRRPRRGDACAPDRRRRPAVVGCGVNGQATARTFLARDREVLLWDARPDQARLVADELGEGAFVADDRADALASDIVVTVTPVARCSSTMEPSTPGNT